MKAYDYEAVVYDGNVYCIGCLPDGVDEEDLEPIFALSEWDCYPVCDACGEAHEYVCLTEDGQRWRTERDGPQEGDLVTHDQDGIQVITSQDGELFHLPTHGATVCGMEHAVKCYCDLEGSFPNVWFVSDHGNAHLLTF